MNGNKRWIGNGTFADVNVIWARRTDTKKVTAFLVEKNSPGFVTRKIENKLALRTVQNADMEFSNVFVPDSHHLPKADGFGGATNEVLQSSRLIVSALATGIQLGAYDAALPYCLERRQFHQPIAKFQLIQERLMRALGNVQATYLTMVHAARLQDDKRLRMGHTTLCKAWSTNLGRETVRLCRECVGGNGIVADFGVMRHLLDMEAVHTYEGTYDINILVAGRDVTNMNALV